jgi:hypothetical protein
MRARFIVILVLKHNRNNYFMPTEIGTNRAKRMLANQELALCFCDR